jgi:hypothetical protein
MGKNAVPPNTKRDAIISPSSSGGANPKRADLLNGQPRTKSLGSQSANYSEAKGSDHWNSAPPPNNPYGKG